MTTYHQTEMEHLKAIISGFDKFVTFEHDVMTI